MPQVPNEATSIKVAASLRTIVSTIEAGIKTSPERLCILLGDLADRLDPRGAYDRAVAAEARP